MRNDEAARMIGCSSRNNGHGRGGGPAFRSTAKGTAVDPGSVAGDKWITRGKGGGGKQVCGIAMTRYIAPSVWLHIDWNSTQPLYILQRIYQNLSSRDRRTGKAGLMTGSSLNKHIPTAVVKSALRWQLLQPGGRGEAERDVYRTIQQY